MVATDQQDAKTKAYKGLLDLLMQDEEKRRKMQEMANRVGTAASTFQQFDVAQPMPAMMGGGLLQQPTHPVMTAAGTGVMGMQPQDNEGEKLKKILKFLNMGA